MRHPFAIVTLKNQSYALPGYFPVPLNTKQEDLKDMTFDIPEPVEQFVHKPLPRIEELVDGSKPGVQYTVKFNGNFWSCTCKGYGFRRSCRHINQTKAKHNI